MISHSVFPNHLEHEIMLERYKSVWRKVTHLAAESRAAENPKDAAVV